MARTFSCATIVAALTTGVLSTSGLAQNSAAPDNFKLDMTENFITQSPGHWESSGAFTDSGTIQDVPKHDIHGASISVLITLAGNNGTITFKWTRINRFAPGEMGNPAALTGGAWQMVGGTGVYSGITGQGVFNGTINFETGDIHDTFTGHVSLAQNDPFQFRTIK